MKTSAGIRPIRARMAELAALFLLLHVPLAGACELFVSNWRLAFGNLWAGSSEAVSITASAPSIEIRGVGSCRKADSVTLRILPTLNQGSCGRPCMLRSSQDAFVAYEVGFGSDMRQVVSVPTSMGLDKVAPVVTARIPGGALRQARPGTYSDTVFIEVTP